MESGFRNSIQEFPVDLDRPNQSKRPGHIVLAFLCNKCQFPIPGLPFPEVRHISLNKG